MRDTLVNHSRVHPVPVKRVRTGHWERNERAVTESNDHSNEQAVSSYVGNIIDDRYRIQRLIARGGMGSVFEVQQVYTHQRLAMKVLHEDMVYRKKLVSRFTREARAVCRLSNAHTVRMFDFGRHEALFYLVMEYLDGQDVQQLLAATGPLDWRRVLFILDQVCESLDEAHRAGIIHRDLKPENIMIVKNPEDFENESTKPEFSDFAKVLDFGLAKIRGGTDVFSVQSHRDLFGTPFYMAPEQIRNEEVDHRSDIYALGCLVFRMLTDQHAVDAPSTFDVLRKHLLAPIPSVCERLPDAHIPVRVDRLVWRALAKHPENRFDTVSSMRREIAGCLSDPGGESMDVADWQEELDETTAAIDSDLEERLRAFEEAHQLNQDILDGSNDPKEGKQTLGQSPIPPEGATEQQPAGALSPGSNQDSSATHHEFDPLLDEEEFTDDIDDAFRRSLRHRWIYGVVSLILTVAAVAGAILFFVSTATDEVLTEHEPNNSPALATVIQDGQTITGLIGEPLSRFESDRDYYRIYLGGTNRYLSLHLSGVQHMNIMMDVLDASGHHTLAHLDHSGPDLAETIHRLPVAESEVLINVTESKDGADIASSGNEHTYALTVTVGLTVPMPGEIEPNDTVHEASAGGLGDPHTGHLDGYGDIDHYAYSLNRNTTGDQWRFSVNSEKTVPIRLELLRRLPGEELVLLYADEDRDGVMNSSFAEAPPMTEEQLGNQRIQYFLSIQHGGYGLERSGYTIRTTREPMFNAREIEPNHDRDHAVPVVFGQLCTGELSGTSDVDMFSIPVRDPKHKTIEVVTTVASLKRALLTVSDSNPLNARDFQLDPNMRNKRKDDKTPVVMRFSGTGKTYYIRVTARKNLQFALPYRFRVHHVMTDTRQTPRR